MKIGAIPEKKKKNPKQAGGLKDLKFLGVY